MPDRGHHARVVISMSPGPDPTDRAYPDGLATILAMLRAVLPHKEPLPARPTCYQTALHELAHWTGRPERLNRATLVEGIREGARSPQYAREELRAEISSMITGDRLQLGHDSSRHAAYVSHWIQALKDDPREIYRAAQDAQVMSDYLLDRTREKVTERESRVADQRERPPMNPIRHPEGRPERHRLFQRDSAAPSR